jgi:hypothetical protein
MNHRYFGDTRDLFKFDLVRHIMKSLPELEGFTFVPMLTETIDTGNRKSAGYKDLDTAYRSGKAGSQNRELKDQLERLQTVTDDVEYLDGIGTYFTREKIRNDISGRQKFTDRNHDSYFRSIFDAFPKNSLIFLDPDTGISDTKADQKHVLLLDVKKIRDRMDMGSALMIYQYFPRVNHDKYVEHLCMQMKKRAGSDPVIITDNEIVFFLITKNQKLEHRLRNTLECYADTYPALSTYCDAS